MGSKLKSTEFWLSLIAIVFGALLGAGFIGDGTIYARVGGWVVTALASAGYTWARTLAKAADGASKPGYKTTEFWKMLAAAVLIWLQAHVVPQGSQWAEMIGYALTFLPAGAYAVSRGALKGVDAGASAAPAASSPPPVPKAA